MPNHPARRLPVMIALAVVVGVGFASTPAPARADDGPTGVPVSPVDGALFDSGDLEFVWSGARDATDFELRVGLDGRIDLSGALVDAPSTATLLTTVPAVAVRDLPEGTYYWQVRALDSSGDAGAWSPVRTVTVDLPGDGGGLQLETLALGDYAVEQTSAPRAAPPSGPGAVGLLSMMIASGFSALLLSVVLLRAAAVRVRT